MKQIAILGAHGFIGTHLCNTLLENDQIQLTLFTRSHKEEIVSPRVRYIHADFSELDKYKMELRKMDCVYHLISQSYPFTTWDKPLVEIQDNLIPTLHLLEAIAGYVERIIFISSGGTIYGNHDQMSDEGTLPKPINPHGIIKLSIEHFLFYYQIKHQLNYLIYRVSNVYGPGQMVNKGLGFINTAIDKISKGEPLTLFGKGLQTRDFIFVKDVAKVLAKSAFTDVLNKTYNLSAGHSYSLKNIIDVIAEEMKIPIQIQQQPARSFDIQRIDLDNTLLLQDYSDIDFTSIQQGIKETVSAILANK